MVVEETGMVIDAEGMSSNSLCKGMLMHKLISTEPTAHGFEKKKKKKKRRAEEGEPMSVDAEGVSPCI